MTKLDNTLPSKVTSIISTYGVSAVIFQFTSYTYDPTSGALASDSETSTTITVAPISSKTEFMGSDSTTRNFEASTYISGESAVTPKTGDRLVVSGSDYKIVSVDVLRCGDSVAAYEVGLRK
tara:strand:- start:272 stop:637 length:366 start_codon:yes stop_codon:yes gene_type:complete